MSWTQRATALTKFRRASVRLQNHCSTPPRRTGFDSGFDSGPGSGSDLTELATVAENEILPDDFCDVGNASESWLRTVHRELLVALLEVSEPISASQLIVRCVSFPCLVIIERISIKRPEPEWRVKPSFRNDIIENESNG